MTSLQDAAATKPPTGGLYFSETLACRRPPFDRMVHLKQAARTIETINEVRKQVGLPEHIPEGYDQPKHLPDSIPEESSTSDLVPPSQPLPTPGPATRFAVVNGRIDIVPAEIWKNQKEQAAAYHARACKLAATLAERLSKTDAVPDVAASVAALGGVLGDSVESVQPDQLRLASRSIAARARAYGHPAAQWEIRPTWSARSSSWLICWSTCRASPRLTSRPTNEQSGSWTSAQIKLKPPRSHSTKSQARSKQFLKSSRSVWRPPSRTQRS